jgi:hypothetical protein
MLYQIQVGQNLVGGVVSNNFEVPFYGRYKVILRRIEYVYNAGAGIIQNLLRLQSNTLLVNTPLMNGFMFVNNSNTNYNLVLNEDLEMNGRIDITLTRVAGQGVFPQIGVAGGYLDCLITLDFEKVVQDQTMIGFSGNKPLFNF